MNTTIHDHRGAISDEHYNTWPQGHAVSDEHYSTWITGAPLVMNTTIHDHRGAVSDEHYNTWPQGHAVSDEHYNTWSQGRHLLLLDYRRMGYGTPGDQTSHFYKLHSAAVSVQEHKNINTSQTGWDKVTRIRTCCVLRGLRCVYFAPVHAAGCGSEPSVTSLAEWNQRTRCQHVLFGIYSTVIHHLTQTAATCLTSVT